MTLFYGLSYFIVLFFFSYGGQVQIFPQKKEKKHVIIS